MDIQYNPPHWNYFKLLEKDLEESFEYVPPCNEHENVYSDYFSRIILMACSELENCFKEFGNEIKYQPVPDNINSFFACITSKYPKIVDSQITIPRYGLNYKPFDGWQGNSPPDWWTNGYNKIKHDSLNNIDAPSLHRAILSVAALLTVLLHLYRVKYGSECHIPATIAPILFDIENIHDANHGLSGLFLDWKLPDEI